MKILSSSIPGFWLAFTGQHMDLQDASCPPGIYLPHQVSCRSSNWLPCLALGLFVYQNHPFADIGFLKSCCILYLYFFNLFLNWRIIALQNFVVFCQTSTWISHQFSSVQLLSCVWLFATPWIAAHQASLSITISRSSLRLTSIESVMPSSHLILCSCLLLLPPNPSQHQSLFQWVNSSHEVAKVLEFQL